MLIYCLCPWTKGKALGVVDTNKPDAIFDQPTSQSMWDNQMPDPWADERAANNEDPAPQLLWAALKNSLACTSDDFNAQEKPDVYEFEGHGFAACFSRVHWREPTVGETLEYLRHVAQTHKRQQATALVPYRTPTGDSVRFGAST